MSEPSVTYSFSNGAGNYIDATEVNQNYTDILAAIKSASSADLGCATFKINGVSFASAVVNTVTDADLSFGTVTATTLIASNVVAASVTAATGSISSIDVDCTHTADAFFDGRIVMNDPGDLDSPGSSTKAALYVDKPYYLYTVTHANQTGGYGLIAGLYVGQRVAITRTANSGPVYCTIKFGYEDNSYDIQPDETVELVYAGGTTGWSLVSGDFSAIY